MKKIVFVVSSILTVKAFLIPHIRTLSPYYQIYVIADLRDVTILNNAGLDINVFSVPIKRSISPLKDIFALVKLSILFNKLQVDLVFSQSPKAGLLAMLAGKLMSIPARIHMFTGQVWKNKSGITRWFLKSMDKLLANCATFVLVDSHSQRQFILEEGIVNNLNSNVLENGSVCGVNTGRFKLDLQKRATVRNEFNLSENSVVFLFLGRVKRDKGVIDLVHSFNLLVKDYPEAYLMIVGPDEDKLTPELRSILSKVSENFIFLEYTDNPENFMMASDIFCLPSYREGFGSVILEAAAVGVPAIGSKIYGIIDAVVEGETGLLFPPGDQNALLQCMKDMIKSKDYRIQMGKNAFQRANKLFSENKLTEAMHDFIEKTLN